MEARNPFDPAEFMRGLKAALTESDTKDAQEAGVRHDVDFIVDEIERNPGKTFVILRTLADSWRDSVQEIPSNAVFQRLQLECVIYKLATRREKSSQPQQQPDSDLKSATDTLEAVEAILGDE